MAKNNDEVIKELESVIARLRREKQDAYDKSIKARNNDIVALRDKGWVYEKIGKKYGITRERVRQILLEKEKESL